MARMELIFRTTKSISALFAGIAIRCPNSLFRLHMVLTMLKQSLWAGDFLGNLHNAESDEEVDASTAKSGREKDQGLRLGVSSADGMQGMVLTEEVWNKLLYVHDNLFYNPSSKALGALASGTYLPHTIDVEETGE